MSVRLSRFRRKRRLQLLVALGLVVIICLIYVAISKKASSHNRRFVRSKSGSWKIRALKRLHSSRDNSGKVQSSAAKVKQSKDSRKISADNPLKAENSRCQLFLKSSEKLHGVLRQISEVLQNETSSGRTLLKKFLNETPIPQNEASDLLFIVDVAIYETTWRLQDLENMTETIINIMATTIKDSFLRSTNKLEKVVTPVKKTIEEYNWWTRGYYKEVLQILFEFNAYLNLLLNEYSVDVTELDTDEPPQLSNLRDSYVKTLRQQRELLKTARHQFLSARTEALRELSAPRKWV